MSLWAIFGVISYNSTCVGNTNLSSNYWGGTNILQGLIAEDRVDSFNLPFYAASPDEMAELVEQNGYFSIERMELTNPVPSLEGPIDIRAWIMHLRAATEGVFIKHFGREAIDEIFKRLIKKLSNYSELLNSRTNVKVQLFAVLKRKWCNLY